MASMPRNHSFDLLRGVAALLIVVFHLEKIGSTPLPGGFLAVDFFFVLSGYVITAAYEERLRKGLPFASLAEIRIVRLFPLACLGTMLGIIKTFSSSIAHQPLSHPLFNVAVAVPFNLLLLPAPPPAPEMFVLNQPVWSLFFELAANAVFAAVMFRASTRAVAGVVALSALGFLGCSIAQGGPGLGWSWETFVGGLFRVGYGFFIGQMIFRCRKFLPSTRQTGWAIILPVALAVVLLSPVYDSWQTSVWIVSAMLIAPAIVTLAVILELPPRLHALSAFLGDLSYPIYAIHVPLLFVLGFLFRRFGVPTEAYVALTLPVIGALAILAARFFDAPARRWLSVRLRVRLSARYAAIASVP